MGVVPLEDWGVLEWWELGWGRRRGWEGLGVLMLPNFAGLELAPTTAKAGYEKKVLAAASVADIVAVVDVLFIVVKMDGVLRPKGDTMFWESESWRGQVGDVVLWC